MSNTSFSEEQVMLTLACCSYLGFDLPPRPDKEQRLRELTGEKLDALAPLQNRCKIVGVRLD